MGGSPARAVKNIIKPSKPVTAPVAAPTVAEVSQSSAVDMDGYDSRKVKARGRSTTVLTGPRGVEEETVTLGRRSLLGA